MRFSTDMPMPAITVASAGAASLHKPSYATSNPPASVPHMHIATAQPRLMLARVLWPERPGVQSLAPPLDAVKYWLASHHVCSNIDVDGDGCWLFAPLTEGDLSMLQNDMLNALGIDLFIAYLWHPEQNGNPSTLARWRHDIDQTARAASLSYSTQPIACMHTERASALAVFRRHVSINAINFAMQPIWNLSTKTPVGHELLARIKEHPTQSWIPHVVSGHDSITLAKLALTNAKHCLGTDGKTYLSINLTAGDFLDPALRSSISAWPIEKRQRLLLELTEWRNPKDSNGLQCAIRSLQDEGVRVAIDDFGAGYSSTVILREIAFDVVKLDMSLVRSRRRSDIELIRWVSACAHEMGASVVAEGIESPDDLRSIMGLDIAYGQGWLLDKQGQAKCEP